jgi:hypothetical protein
MHGANVMVIKKQCNFEGCTKHATKGGFCVTHDPKREMKRCGFEGCPNQVVKGGVCCSTHVQRCIFKGCPNQVYKRGYCMTHGDIMLKKKRCSFEGCANGVINGGVCVMHLGGLYQWKSIID